jgi:hypothetical protein
MLHQVIGGRLYFVDPEGQGAVGRAEAAAASAEAARRPLPPEALTVVRSSPAKPPIARHLGAFLRPGHPDPRFLYSLAQADRVQQLAQIQQAASLAQVRTTRYLGAGGAIWLVDGQPLFVREADLEMRQAIEARLARGDLQPLPASPIVTRPPALASLFRIFPVGDTP